MPRGRRGSVTVRLRRPRATWHPTFYLVVIKEESRPPAFSDSPETSKLQRGLLVDLGDLPRTRSCARWMLGNASPE